MDNNGRPNHIEDYLVKLHTNQWFGWTNPRNKVYANLKLSEKVGIGGNIVDNLITELPTEQQCTDGLATLQSNFDTAKTNRENKLASGKQKLKDLGLDDDELKQILGI